MIVLTILTLLVTAGVMLWRSSAPPAKASAENKQDLQERLRKGLGSEVRFASRSEEADEAVASAAEFIHSRSGLKLSDELKSKLAKAEGSVLNGKSRHIPVDELIGDMTTVVVDRLATLTDKEILLAAEASSDPKGQIRSRANAKWGVMSEQDLVNQAQAGREWSKRGDAALRTGLHSMIEGEVNSRLNDLSGLLPEQFGNARSRGLTPTQALLIAYSVAADDPLTNSRSDIAEQLKQKRMDEGFTREQWKEQKLSGRPYGPRGWIHPSAAQLFFTRNGVDKLLNFNEGGKN